MLLGKVFQQTEAICRIKVLSEIKVEHNTIISCRNEPEIILDIVGETGSVFVHNNYKLNLYNGEYVFFSITENKIIKEEGDKFILDHLHNEFKAFSLLHSQSKNISEILKDRYIIHDANENFSCYVKYKEKVLGQFIYIHTTNRIQTPSPGITYINSWDFSKLKVLDLDDDQSLLLENPLHNKEHEVIDISDQDQLFSWFKKRIKDYGGNDLKGLLPQINGFLNVMDTNISIIHEKEKLDRIRQLWSKLNFNYDEIESVLQYDSILTKLDRTLLTFKYEYLKENSIKFNAELELINQSYNKRQDDLETEFVVRQKKIKKELDQLDNQIKEKNILLDEVQNNILKQKKSANILEPLIEKFSSHKNEIVQQTIMLQSVLGNSITDNNTTRLKSHKYLSSDEENVSDIEFYSEVSCSLKKQGMNVSKSKIRTMNIAIETFKGIFVPNIYWGKFFCDARPYYHHLSIAIDPSIKNISDLWNLYLGDIVEIAEQNNSNKYFLHFNGINNSVADVWMNAIKNLVEFENSTVPVKGLPLWPKNIYFFFTPTYHEYSFNLTDTIFSLFPSIHEKEIEYVENTLDAQDIYRVHKLTQQLSIKTNKEKEDVENISKDLLFNYSKYYLNVEAH